MSYLERRKTVRVRLRRNLDSITQEEDGQTYSVIKDPLSLQYYRLEKGQRFVCDLMDGEHSLDEIQKAYEHHFRPERLSLEELEAFASQLIHAGLAQTDSPSTGKELFERTQEQRRNELVSTLLNIFYIKIPLFDPDRFLHKLLTVLGFVFTFRFVALSGCMMLAAIALLATHWNDFLTKLPTYNSFFCLQTLVYLWIALGLVKVLHEFGHALCCKAFGGEVHEMGVLLLLYFPSLYCNTSDAWIIRCKWQRIAVNAAGIYAELLVAALATFIWWETDPESVLHNLCLGLMVVCSVNTVVCNANPLMRFDGYFALSDLLGIPNLSEHSKLCAQSLCKRWLGMAGVSDLAGTGLRRGFLACYAVSSYAYRCAATVAGLYFLHSFLKPYRLGSISFFLGAGAAFTFLGWPGIQLVRAIHKRGRLPEVKLARVGLLLGALIVAVIVVWTVPLPMTIEGPALVQVEPDHVERVVVPDSGGFLEEILVRDGQHIQAGDIIAILSNLKLETSLRVNEADQALRFQQQSALIAQLSEIKTRESKVLESLQQTGFELEGLRQQHMRLQEQKERLALCARISGTVMQLQTVEVKGKWLEKGTEICHVGNEAMLRAVLLLEPSDRKLAVPGSQAWFRVRGGGYNCRPALLKNISQVETDDIPRQLSSRTGGEVVTRQDPLSKTERPQSQHYLVAVELQELGNGVQPGALGRVKIEAGSQTLWWRVRRYLANTFNWGL